MVDKKPRANWDMGRPNPKDWNPTKYAAKCCGDSIWSERPGQFKECKCGKAFVDQTTYYTRLGGEVEEDGQTDNQGTESTG